MCHESCNKFENDFISLKFQKNCILNFHYTRDLDNGDKYLPM